MPKSSKWLGQIALETNEASHMLKLAKAFGLDAIEQHDIIDEIAARAHRLLDDERAKP